MYEIAVGLSVESLLTEFLLMNSLELSNGRLTDGFRDVNIAEENDIMRISCACVSPIGRRQNRAILQ